MQNIGVSLKYFVQIILYKCEMNNYQDYAVWLRASHFVGNEPWVVPWIDMDNPL